MSLEDVWVLEHERRPPEAAVTVLLLGGGVGLVALAGWMGVRRSRARQPVAPPSLPTPAAGHIVRA